MTLAPSDTALTKLSWRPSIDKSHGGSINKLGGNLSQPVVSHCQLYVGLSRAGIPQEERINLWEIMYCLRSLFNDQMYEMDILILVIYPLLSKCVSTRVR